MCVIHQPWPSSSRMITAPIQCSAFAAHPHRVVVLRVMNSLLLLGVIPRAERSQVDAGPRATGPRHDPRPVSIGPGSRSRRLMPPIRLVGMTTAESACDTTKAGEQDGEIEQRLI